MKKLLSVLLVTALLTACASTGVRVTEEQVSKFTEGQSTRHDVIETLGNPTTAMRNSDGTTTLMYTYAESRTRASTFVPIVGMFAGGVDTRSTHVVFTFDKNGVLTSSSSSEGELGSASGIAVDGGDPVLDQPRK